LSLEDDRPNVADGLVFPSNGLVPAGVFKAVRSAELGSSGGSPLIAMMKPSDPGHRDDPTQLRATPVGNLSYRVGHTFFSRGKLPAMATANEHVKQAKKNEFFLSYPPTFSEIN
jgi:hypothetical protein